MVNGGQHEDESCWSRCCQLSALHTHHQQCSQQLLHPRIFGFSLMHNTHMNCLWHLQPTIILLTLCSSIFFPPSVCLIDNFDLLLIGVLLSADNGKSHICYFVVEVMCNTQMLSQCELYVNSLTLAPPTHPPNPWLFNCFPKNICMFLLPSKFVTLHTNNCQQCSQ